MNEDEDYTSSLLRGISNKEDLINIEGALGAKVGAFQFKESTTDPNKYELSINWEDDLGAISSLKEQLKEGRQQFVGSARLESTVRDSINRNPILNLDYERAPSEDNNYHGNLLVLNPEKAIIKIIMGALAANVIYVEQFD